MFGYVIANFKELEKPQLQRYNAVYCGVCRQMRLQSGGMTRFGLSYDIAFLALLLMSLYEPEETSGKRACWVHPVIPRAWIDNTYIRYAADMNVALAYYKALDDWNDDGKRSAKYMSGVFGKELDAIRARYPRQCAAIARCIETLSALEKENCANPDEPANCFGELMAELLVYKEDLWAATLRRMGMALGRFIYLGDAVRDYPKDLKSKKYNPLIALGGPAQWSRWEQYLVLAMARCTEEFEKLPLVQDKKLLDNILYSGVWVNFRGKNEQEDGHP